MGKGDGLNGSQCIDANVVRPRGGYFEVEELRGVDILPPEEASKDFGSDAYWQRMGEYARAQSNRPRVRLHPADDCARCGHSFSEHTHGRKRGCDYCECAAHIPNGTSYTDMNGSIWVRSDTPPDSDDIDREIYVRGVLNHEICHELYTDETTFHDVIQPTLTKIGREEGQTKAGVIKTFWNILEDGMIEARERHLRPERYRLIAAIDGVYPRLGKEGEVVEQEYKIPAPEGFIPEDFDGNPLPVETDPATGMSFVRVPAGTRITTWGEKPMIPLSEQARRAIHGEALTMYEVGELHPDVQKAFDECKPHIDAAVRGNTADCFARAFAVYEILDRHGLVEKDPFENMTDEEKEQFKEQLKEALKQMMQEAGDSGGPETPGMPGGGSGGGSSGPLAPANGMPGGGGGSPLPPDLQEIFEEAMEEAGIDPNDLPGGGGGDQGENGQQSGSGGGGQQGAGQQSGPESGAGGGEQKADGDDKSEGQAGGGSGDQTGDTEKGEKSGAGDGSEDGDGETSQNGKNGEGQGDGGSEGESSGEKGDKSGDGESGSSTETGKSENGENGQNNGSEGKQQNQGNRTSARGGGGGGGFDPNTPLPQSSREFEDPKNARHAARKQIQQEKEQHKSTAEKDFDVRKRSGKLTAGDFRFADPREKAYTQKELRNRSTEKPLPDEQGQIFSAGRRLATKIKRMKTEAQNDQKRLKRGRLDGRSISRAMAGDPKVYHKKGINPDLDLEIDVSIDRSGSVTPPDTANQYRMAKMMAVAAKETDVPMAIYGWSGDFGGETQHYAFKERHSDDMASIDAIFQTGGGSTPTSEGVRFAAARLRTSKKKNKVMVVVTDGGANDIEDARQKIEASRKAGIEVVGIAFCGENEDASRLADDMDAQFGKGKWNLVRDYLQAPEIVSSLIERVAISKFRRRR